MLDFRNGVDGFFHSLIPRSLRETLLAGSPEYIKARALSVLLFFFIVFQAIEIIFVGGWHLLYQPQLLKHELVALGIFSLFVIQSILFYKFSNHWLSALAFTSIYFLIAVVLVLISGGYQSPMKILLLTCPFMAFLIGDKHEGIQTSILVALIGIVLAFLDSINFTTPDFFSGAEAPIVFAIDLIITLTLIMVALFVYESALIKRENTKAEPAIDTEKSGADSLFSLIDKLVDNLVPGSVTTSLPLDRIGYIRVRFLSALLFTIVVMGVLTIFPAIASFSISNNSVSIFLAQNIVAVVMLLFFVLQLWLFNHYGNYDLSSIVFTNSYFLIVGAMVLSSGGYDSPLKCILVTPPIIAFVIGGVRAGVQNSFYSAIIGISLAAFKIIGFEFSDIFVTQSHQYLAFGANWLVILSIMLACSIVYETELQRTKM
jgi:hypothetical protein